MARSHKHPRSTVPGTLKFDAPDMPRFLAFVRLMMDFQQTQTDAGGRNRVEQNYRLAMAALYLVATKPRRYSKLESLRVLVYSLFWRLTEARDSEGQLWTVQRLSEEFPEFPDLADWAEQHNRLRNPESRFVAKLEARLDDDEELAGITRLTDSMQRIVRRASVPGRTNYENDAEHSLQVVAATLYLTAVYPRHLRSEDRLRMVVYGLVHDVVEIYAGDVPWGQPTAGKRAAEARAVKTTRTEFAKYPQLANWMEGYEAKRDEDARIVYLVDKLIGNFIIYLSEGLSWRENGQTFEFVFYTTRDKFSHLPGYSRAKTFVDRMYMQLVVTLYNHPELFGSAGSST